MASDNEASCASDPNFAVICSFLECFGKSCGIVYPDIARLQEMIENAQDVPQQLIDLHIKLLRKTRKTVSPEKWERALVKFCHTYSNQDGWELERFGYKKARIAVKLRLLKVLLETQFDQNQKFKNEVNKLAANELRVEPLGKDKSGLAYWCQLDEECNIRVYREDIDEENWELVAKDREGVVNLINTLTNGEIGPIPINEDSNSLEISEKPIIDTGQMSTSPSLQDDGMQENGIHNEELENKGIEKCGAEEIQGIRDEDDVIEHNNMEDDMDCEDEMTSDENSKQNTEKDSEQIIENDVLESHSDKISPLVSTPSLEILNGKADILSEKESVLSQEADFTSMQETVKSTVVPNPRSMETYKSEEQHTAIYSSKVDFEEPLPVKSIETPVITSPLKLISVSELKQVHEEKMVTTVTPVGTVLNITKKHEDLTESVVKPLDKLQNKGNFPFVPVDVPTAHSKLSMKPIDQLAANLVRMQSEKLEKPSGAKSLEKIAENLARTGSIVGNVVNGDDDRLPQDFCARSQMEKPNMLREHRGMDLSTSPRGWESTNEQNRPMDFSGIDLSSRKFNKIADLPSPGYRTQDFQHREMDLSTKKLNKSELTNLPYDARPVMIRNHAMVADLSKRQMAFPTYDMSSAPYHNASRIPNKEDHRLPNYTILPDPSKIAALRINTTPVKRALDADEIQHDMLKRIRADVIPIRGSMDKRPIMNSNWRDEVGEAIEEPMMMIQGEGSGSDCDAVNHGLGEAVEEPIIFFYGEGSGEDCETGNPGENTSANNNESNESKNEADSATSSLSPNKTLSDGSLMNDVSTGAQVTNKISIKLNRNFPQSSVSIKSNCQPIGPTQEKSKFKPTLGIQIIPKNSGSPVKRLSRWDVGKPEDKPECDSSIISNEEDISQKKNDTKCDVSPSGKQSVKVDENSVMTQDIVTEKKITRQESLQNTAEKSSADEKQSPVPENLVPCDSSISSSKADTSHTSESCGKVLLATNSVNNTYTTSSSCDSDNITLQLANASEKDDNECKPVAPSPPRFFFGPNCISYTSRPEIFESQSDQTVSTSVESKSESLQYESVSSSKPTEMIEISRKLDFDVGQMNNNSIKVNSCTSESSEILCEENNQNNMEKIQTPKLGLEEPISPKSSINIEICTTKKEEPSLSNSKSKEETPCIIDSTHESISSTEGALEECTKSEETEILEYSEPHSTNAFKGEDVSTNVEPEITSPSTIQPSSPTKLTHNEPSQKEEPLEMKKSDLVSSGLKTVEPQISYLENEVNCEPSDTLLTKTSTLETDLISTETSEVKHEESFDESDCPRRTETAILPEVSSPAIKEVKNIPEEQSDLPIEAYNENDKNDVSGLNDPGDQLINLDNEKVKSLIGSDTSTTYNENESSENIEALQQKDIPRDFEGAKEETIVDSFSKSPVPDVNTKLNFTDNVTSSESLEQYNKEALVPTISSSDDACIKDTSINESIKVQSDSEMSSFKDECPIYNVLPETVPETNNFKPSKCGLECKEEQTSISNVMETETLNDRSSCVDQLINKDLIIDDKLFKSQDLPKLNERKVHFNEASSDCKQKYHISIELCSSSDQINKFDAAPLNEEAEDFINIQEKSDVLVGPIVLKCDNRTELTENKSMDQRKDATEFCKENTQETKTENLVCKNTKPAQSEIITEDVVTEGPHLTKIDVSLVSLQEPIEIKQPLVANYDSTDSNDSNDAYDAEPELIENKSDFFTNLGETMISKEQNEKQIEEKIDAKDEVLHKLYDTGSSYIQEKETNIENTPSDETEHTQEETTIQKKMEEEYSSTAIQEKFTEKAIINEKNISTPVESLSVEVTKTEVFPVTSATEPVNKEFISSVLTKVNNITDELIEAESHCLTDEEMTNKVSYQKDISPKKDLVNEMETQKETKEHAIFNDTEKDVTGGNLKEKCMEEKFITSLDNEVDFLKSTEEVMAEPPIMDSYNKLKEFAEFGNKENKLNTHLHEESDLNKHLLRADVSVHAVRNILPLDKFDNISSDIDKAKIYENNISSGPENIKPVDNLQFANFISEKSDNINIIENHEKHNESLQVVSKEMEPPSENTASNLNDNSVAFNMQKVASESITSIEEYKKETNKRFSDAADIHDVPPLKSKLLCVESDESICENLSNSKVQLHDAVDNNVHVEVSTGEIKVSEDTAAENTEDQLTKTEAIASADTSDTLVNEIEKKHHEDDDDKKKTSDIHSIELKAASLASDDSMDMDNDNIFNAAPEEMDPLAGTDDDMLRKLGEHEQNDNTSQKIGLRLKPVSELIYDGWKLDSTESPKVSRKRRNSSHESNSDDMGTKEHDDEAREGKRIKLRAKRMPDKQLRHSVESSRDVGLSSEDEAAKCSPEKPEDQEAKDASDDQSTAHSTAIERKGRGRPRGRRRRGYRASGRLARPKYSEFQSNQASEISPQVLHDGTASNNDSLNSTPLSQKKRKKRKMVLGLEIGRDIAPETEAKVNQDETPVRQSRRIAQLKIKEEADRRRIEEETSIERKEKKDSSEKKKRKKQKPESEEDVTIKDIEKEISKSKKKRKKRKKKKMLAKFNEANPWQSSSGSSSDDENENDEEDDEEEEIESEGSLLFKSDHEFSPESDLEKDQESEPLRRARTAQKAQSDVEEADDEYACQKCGKADHPEWILLCDSCDKGWHCSCLRPALMLIPEGDWFCPPCQHNLLVTKLRESLKTYDQLTKRHENEVLRKKRLAFVGISLDNVLHKNESQHHQKGSKASSQESDNESSTASSSTSTETSSSDESEPVYQLRERRCANRYKFNDYDAMINAAIQDEVEAVQGAGNQGRGKDITTIVNAKKEEAQLHFKNEELDIDEMPESKDDTDRKSEKDSDEEYKVEGEDIMDDEEEEHKGVVKKLLSRKRHRKLNSLDISSDDDPESDEDFKGTSSEDEEDFDEHITSSDESSFADVKRRGKKGDSRSVRRSTRARTTRYDEDFINDDSEESDRPKRKKSRSAWDSDNEDSDNSWRQQKKKSRTISTSRSKAMPKTKSRKKKKRKRIIESDNQSDNDDSNEDMKIETSFQVSQQLENDASVMSNVLDVKLENLNPDIQDPNTIGIKDVKLEDTNPEMPHIATALPLEEITQQRKKKDNSYKTKKTIRRKIIYGGLPDENKPEEEEILSRRTRGRKINYQEEIASDSEEELKKALRKTGESEDEFVVNEGEDLIEDAEKDSDSGDIYNPKKDGHKLKNKSPKNRRPGKSKSPGGKRKILNDGMPKQRKKPGPKPGSKNKSRKQSFLLGSVIQRSDDQDAEKDIMANVMDNPIGEINSKIDDNLSENVGLTSGAMSVASSFTGDVPDGSLTGLGAGELAELDDEQLEQMMMEDEEYGRRQLELAAIEIAKKKKKEEREAKKLEKARLKALEILAAERQRDPNTPEGLDGEVPKKKKRGRRSKAEILAEQMRRDGAPNLNTTVLPATVPQSMSPNINPSMSAIMTPDAERTGEGHIPMMTGPDGQLFNPDGSPMKPKRRGRGKGKKTLALEAARAAEAAAKAAAEAGLIGMSTDSNSEIKPGEIPNVLPTPGSSTSGSAPSTPPAGVVTTQGPPASQTPTSQSVYPSLPPNQQSSVITRMLQSQPVSSSPQSFSAAAAAMGHKYFGGPNTGGQLMGGPRTGYEMQPRGRIPSPYRQAGQSSMPPHFAAVRSGTPPMRMRVPGPQMYHTPHHPMDPSPSGGGPISINNRDRSSPLGPGPAMIPPTTGSPLAKGGPTPPPPNPYARGAPPMSRFADNPLGPRHQMPPFTNASPVNHSMQQPSPPPNRPPGNFSPYHPPPPPNYHYGAYPPPPPMSTADDAAAYQGSPYPADHFSSPADSQPPIPAPQPPPQQQTHPNDAGAGNKQYDEEGTGEFGGLVSYFSSQREDDLES